MSRAVVFLMCACLLPSSAMATAYRMTRIELQDPHFRLQLIFCLDLTNNSPIPGLPSANGYLADLLSTDSDGDGLLDLNLVLEFDQMNPSAPGGELDFAVADCTTPVAATDCTPGVDLPQRTSYTNGSTGSCLSPIAGTTGPYPPLIEPGAPCFATMAGDLNFSINLLGLDLQLDSMQLAARYVDGDSTRLLDGLMIAFLTEEKAASLVFPQETPLLGGLPLTILLPGGADNCASYDDRDIGPDGSTGWYLYFNFEAERVPLEAACAGLTLDAPGSGYNAMDNGCFRNAMVDSIVWDFDWSDCATATQYHLKVSHPTSQVVMIDEQNISTSSFHYACHDCYIPEAERSDWRWMVRGRVGENWGPWSEERSFAVEPLNTDCMPATVARRDWSLVKTLYR